MFGHVIAAIVLCAEPSPSSVAATVPVVSTDRGSWTSFRNGGRSSIESSIVPSVWNPESIRWQRELPGYGQSSPALFGERLYLTAVEGDQKEQAVLLAVDAATGETIFRVDLPASSTAPSKYSVARGAPTPAVDDFGAYAFFESGDFVAVSHEGETLWKRSLVSDYGPFETVHGLGGSPALDGETLYLNVQHRGTSYLLAIDKRTGKNRWKVDRPSGSSWGTPVIGELAGTKQIVISAGGAVDGYDPADGEMLWTVDGLDGVSIPSPTIVDGFVYVGADLSERSSAEKVRKSNCCLRVVREGEGYRAEVVWSAERALAHYASPLVHAGDVYYVSKQGAMQCVDALTGEERYVERLGSPCWCTPVACGDRVFFFKRDGSVAVVRSGERFELLAENRLWDPAAAPQPETYREYVEPIAAADSEKPANEERRSARSQSADPIVYGVAASANAFYVRTGTRLYSIGSP